MQYSFARHNVCKNHFHINLVKIRIKAEYGRITSKPPKSVSDTGNPYHVACLSVVVTGIDIVHKI